MLNNLRYLISPASSNERLAPLQRLQALCAEDGPPLRLHQQLHRPGELSILLFLLAGHCFCKGRVLCVFGVCFFGWVCFFKKTVKTAVPDDGKPPGELVLTQLVE